RRPNRPCPDRGQSPSGPLAPGDDRGLSKTASPARLTPHCFPEAALGTVLAFLPVTRLTLGWSGSRPSVRTSWLLFGSWCSDDTHGGPPRRRRGDVSPSDFARWVSGFPTRPPRLLSPRGRPVVAVCLIPPFFIEWS